MCEPRTPVLHSPHGVTHVLIGWGRLLGAERLLRELLRPARCQALGVAVDLDKVVDVVLVGLYWNNSHGEMGNDEMEMHDRPREKSYRGCVRKHRGRR